MVAVRVALGALALLVLAAAPADAHRLRIFATVEGGTIEGYAFFVGGGRPDGAVVVDPGGGHVAEVTLGAERFGAAPAGRRRTRARAVR